MAEEFDNFFVNFGAKEGCGATGAERASGDFGRRDAGDVLAFGGGETECCGEVGRGESTESAGAGAGSFVVLVERRFGGAVVGDDVVGDAFEGANGADWFVGGLVSDGFTF